MFLENIYPSVMRRTSTSEGHYVEPIEKFLSCKPLQISKLTQKSSCLRAFQGLSTEFSVFTEPGQTLFGFH